MSYHYKNINKIGILTIAGTAAVELANFVLIPIMTRALGTSGYGTISIYTTWCTFITAVCGLQTTQSIVYIILDKDSGLRKGYFASMLACSAACFVAVAIMSIVIAALLKARISFSILLIVLAFSQSYGNYCVNFANAVFTQEQKPTRQVILSILIAVSTVTLSVLLIKRISWGEAKYYGRICGYAVPYFICGCGITYYYILRNIKDIRLHYIKELLPVCLPVIVHALASIIFSQSDRVMLSMMRDMSIAGIYSYTYSIASLLSVAWVTFNNFYQPFLFSYLKNNDFSMVRKKTTNLLMLYTAMYVVFVLLIPEPAAAYGGEAFASSISYLPILSLGIYFNFLYSFNSNFEIYYKETGIIARGTVLSAASNILLNALLIPRYSIMGAAIATLISFVGLFLFHYFGARKVAKNHAVSYVYSIKEFLLWAAVAVMATVFSYFMEAYMLVRYVLGGAIVIFMLIKTIRQKSII